MFKLSLYWFTSLNTVILIPIYACLAPLCMISSSLFDWTMSWIIDGQTVTLIVILIAEWTISALLIFELIINRTYKLIFYYEFVFFLVCANFVLIGITYSLLQRNNILEEFTAKICTSLLLILAAEKLKIKFTDNDSNCGICLQKMNEQYIILKCKHSFHEGCLWDWTYVKLECPSCRRVI